MSRPAPAFRAHWLLASGIVLLTMLGLGSPRPATAAAAFGLPVPKFEGKQVTAGERVELRWPSLAGEAEELELVLSLDDGSQYDVRVSPQLSGTQSRYVWLVPNLGVRRARLRLRARIRGIERSGPETEPFAIVPNLASNPGLWVYHHGEWWEDGGGVPFAMPGLVTPPRLPTVHCAESVSSFAVTVRAPEVSLPPCTSEPAFVGFTAPRAVALSSAATPQTFRPMRA